MSHNKEIVYIFRDKNGTFTENNYLDKLQEKLKSLEVTVTKVQ